MPKYAFNLLKRNHSDLSQAKIGVVGVAYKGNVDDPRESPFYSFKKILDAHDLAYEVFDPLYTKENTVASLDELQEKSDCLVIVTDHDSVKKMAESERRRGKNIDRYDLFMNALKEMALIEASMQRVAKNGREALRRIVQVTEND